MSLDNIGAIIEAPLAPISKYEGSTVDPHENRKLRICSSPSRAVHIQIQAVLLTKEMAFHHVALMANRTQISSQSVTIVLHWLWWAEPIFFRGWCCIRDAKKLIDLSTIVSCLGQTFHLPILSVYYRTHRC